VYKYGGVCGYVVQGGSGNYWDTESTGQSSGCGGAGSTGLTTSEMQGETAESNMSSLDFNTVWTTVEGDYPQLQDNPE
jgi:hypothetical protein